MQQATQIKEQSTAVTTPGSAPMKAPGTPFVINLCSSTSPVALAPPDHAGLKRFTFFVSRRREEGRERFRLHMGYFQTQEEAEKLLDIVREIYPGAWAGTAPGQRLRAAAAAAAAAQTPAAPIEQEVAPTVVQPAIAPTAVAAASVKPAPVAVVAPAAPAAPAPAAPAPVAAAATVPAPSASPPAPAVATTSAIAAKAAPVLEEISFELIDDGPRNRTEPVEATSAAKAASEADEAARSLSDVRAAIASLEDSAVNAPVLQPPPDLKIPELKPAVVAGAKKLQDKPAAKPVPVAKVVPVAKPVEKPAEAAAAMPESAEELNDEAAISLLEGRATLPPIPSSGKAADPQAPPAAEKPCFAVQLVWSVQPIDVAQVPQLAIFSAYTLYGAEGNRDGRRWYGLRLGFFTDAVSAKQVAHYVRSEFSTVSVVPVTMRERERAKQASTRVEPAAAPQPSPAKPVAAPKHGPGNLVPSAQFEFIEDKAPAAAGSADGQSATARMPQGPRTGKGAPGKRAKLRTPAQMAAKAAAAAKPKKLTLEETLEILGAGDLKVDNGRGELMNSETAANTAAPKQGSKAKPSRLGKLFERLSERIGN